jgi:hypothetical protein
MTYCPNIHCGRNRLTIVEQDTRIWDKTLELTIVEGTGLASAHHARRDEAQTGPGYLLDLASMPQTSCLTPASCWPAVLRTARREEM